MTPEMFFLLGAVWAVAFLGSAIAYGRREWGWWLLGVVVGGSAVALLLWRKP